MKPTLKYEIPEDHPKVKAAAPLTERLSDLVESYMPDAIDNTAIQTTIEVLKSSVYNDDPNDINIMYTVYFSLCDIRLCRHDFLAFNLHIEHYFDDTISSYVYVPGGREEEYILHKTKMLIYDAIHAIIPFAKGGELDVREDGSFHS